MPAARIELIEAQDCYDREALGLGRQSRQGVISRWAVSPRTDALPRKSYTARAEHDYADSPTACCSALRRTPSLSLPAFTPVGIRWSGRAVSRGI